jgi:hypothetical protein
MFLLDSCRPDDDDDMLVSTVICQWASKPDLLADLNPVLNPLEIQLTIRFDVASGFESEYRWI